MSLSKALLSSGLLSSGDDAGIGDCEGRVEDHLVRAYRRMLHQFRPAWDADTQEVIEDAAGPYKLGQLVEVTVAPYQDVEDELCRLLNLRSLATAFGAQLDVIGRIVGITRSDWGVTGDEDFRRLVSAKILVNTSNGSADTLRAVIKAFTGSTFVLAQDCPPASGILEFDEPPFSNQKLLDMIASARLGGVRIDLITCESPTFAFCDDFSGVTDFPGGEGFEDGIFAEVITA